MDLLVLELADPRFAHEGGPAVDPSTARAAFGGFAVKATGEVVREVRLDVVDGVEHDHAFQCRNLEALLLAAIGVSAEDLEDDRAHVRTGCDFGGRGAGGGDAGGKDMASSKSVASSAGISGTGRVLSLTRRPSLNAIKFTRPRAGSFSR